jgi:hypothetical protein
VWGLPMDVKFICVLWGSPFVFYVYGLKLKMYETRSPRVGLEVGWCVVCIWLEDAMDS